MFGTFLGTRIYYEQSGAGEHHVLLLHGWGCTAKHFEPIAQALSEQYHVTAIDFPAHGRSDRPAEPWGVPEFAAMTAELIEQLGLAPVDIIAHSFGARVAIYLAAQYPQLVNRLVLTGAAGLKMPQTPEQKKKSQRYQNKKALWETLKKVPFLRAPAIKMQDALRKKYGSPDYNALDEEMRKTFVKVISQDLSEFLPKIHASTLLVFGENDTETPLWMGQKMEKEIRDAGLVVFEKDDHFAYLRQWPRFTAIVKTFLT